MREIKIFIASSIIIALVGISHAQNFDSHTNYYSLHEETILISYFDENNNLKQEPRQGFLNTHDIEDSKIACNSTLPCKSSNNDQSLLALPTISLGSPGSLPPSNKKRKFRVFIPEGAVELNLTIFCQQSPKLTSVIKFNTTPECTQCNQNFNDTIFSKEDTFAFSKFNSNEVYLQNAGGHISIYSMALFPPDASGKNPPLSKGGWLYINNYNEDFSIGQIQFGFKVDKDIFKKWYSSYKAMVLDSPENDFLGLLKGSSIIPDPSSEILDPIESDNSSQNEYEKGFAAGKKYCSMHPVECGIISIDDSYNLFLNSVDFVPGIPEGPWDIELIFKNGIWKLGNIEETYSY